MSRIGKQPIRIPDQVTVTRGDGRAVVRGPKGEVLVPIHRNVMVDEQGGVLTVTVVRPNVKDDRALWGLTTRLLTNAILGVTVGYTKRLEVHGVGFRVTAKGSTLEFLLGYSHPVPFELPDGVTATIEKNTVTVSGIDKQLVGEVAAKMHALRKPDAYHGKGVRYSGVILKLKPGKAAKGAGG
ncbi:MAG: 50S ribosomal protein L6 [bacterium]|nr:50S ribosomal protein L6 [bacterium]